MTDTSPVVFDPFSDVFFRDPYALYHQLREEAPVHFNEQYGFWALTRHADVLAASHDWRTFTSTRGVDLYTLSMHIDLSGGGGMMIMQDPPDHHRLRSLVSKVFHPRSIQELEPMVTEVIQGFADALDGRSSFDAVEEFAAPFPVEIISRMLGVPASDRQKIRHWIDLMLEREPGEIGPSQAGLEASFEAVEFFDDLAAAKRRHPGDDLLSQLTLATMEREDGTVTGLSDPEIAGFAALLGGAGAETVTKLVSNAFVLFSRHPDQWAAVLEDRSRIGGAVEEILRYWPPSQYQGRYSVQDSDWHGTTIPAGFPVLLVTGAANHDEREYSDPDRFDITRATGHALGFGFGIHTCLGAALARMESRVAIEEMARRWPAFTVDEAGTRRVQMANVAGYASVPVRVGLTGTPGRGPRGTPSCRGL
jgi:cytochrome P450